MERMFEANINKAELDEEITSHNLETMEKDMKSLSFDESIGGNAQSEFIEGKKYTCVGLNGYAHRQTGMILAFGNSQHVPQDIAKSGMQFTMKEAIDVDRNASKIVNFYGVDKFTERGRKNIQASIDAYNKIYWKL